MEVGARAGGELARLIVQAVPRIVALDAEMIE